MENFSPLALKLREEKEDGGYMYCKNAKFLTTPIGMDGQKVYFRSLASFERNEDFDTRKDINLSKSVFLGNTLFLHNVLFGTK